MSKTWTGASLFLVQGRGRYEQEQRVAWIRTTFLIRAGRLHSNGPSSVIMALVIKPLQSLCEMHIGVTARSFTQLIARQLHVCLVPILLFGNHFTRPGAMELRDAWSHFGNSRLLHEGAAAFEG